MNHCNADYEVPDRASLANGEKAKSTNTGPVKEYTLDCMDFSGSRIVVYREEEEEEKDFDFPGSRTVAYRGEEEEKEEEEEEEVLHLQDSDTPSSTASWWGKEQEDKEDAPRDMASTSHGYREASHSISFRELTPTGTTRGDPLQKEIQEGPPPTVQELGRGKERKEGMCLHTHPPTPLRKREGVTGRNPSTERGTGRGRFPP